LHRLGWPVTAFNHHAGQGQQLIRPADADRNPERGFEVPAAARQFRVERKLMTPAASISTAPAATAPPIQPVRVRVIGFSRGVR
jgi:hypothetical protein